MKYDAKKSNQEYSEDAKIFNYIFLINLGLTAPKGAIPVNQTSASDWQN